MATPGTEYNTCEVVEMKTRIVNSNCAIHYIENNDEYHVLAKVFESMNMRIVRKTPYSEIWQGHTCRDIVNGRLIVQTHMVDFEMMEGC